MRRRPNRFAVTRSHALRTLVQACALLVLLTGCSPGAEPTTAPAPGPSGVAQDPARRHIIVVVEENHGYDQIIGSADAPFINRLTGEGTLLTSYEAITKPSLPNYIALLSGGTQGITNDCTDCTVDAADLTTQLEARGLTWRAYLQGLPEPCSDVARSGAYAKKHNPFMYFDAIRGTPGRCANVVPYEQLATDLEAGRLPNFAFVTPDLDHDMHDGTVSTADAWLEALHGRLRSSSAWRDDTRLVVTFDEAGEHGDQHIATLVTGPRVPPAQDPTRYDHYSLLRSVEDAFGLAHLGHAADPATASIPALTGTAAG
jgi:phospholipase C